MDARLIERLDRERFKSMLWITIGFALFLGCLIAAEFIPRERSIPLFIPTLTGLVIMIYGAITSYSNYRTINRYPNLKKALNNELVRHYEYKSFKWGFTAAFFVALILYMFEPRWEALTVKITCLIILYLPFMAYSISYLIYLKR